MEKLEVEKFEVRSQDDLPVSRPPVHLATVEVDCDTLEAVGVFYSLSPAIEALLPLAVKGEVVTIYTYETPSWNFSTPCNSIFIGVVGKKGTLNAILSKYASINGVRCKLSESIPGKDAICSLHVSHGKVWEPHEGDTWHGRSVTNESDNSNEHDHNSDSVPDNEYLDSEELVFNGAPVSDTTDLKAKKTWKGKSHFLLKVFRKFGFLPVIEGEILQSKVKSPVEGENFSAWSERVLGQSSKNICVLQMVQPNGHTLVTTLASSGGTEALASVLSAKSALVKHIVTKKLSSVEVDKLNRTEILLRLRTYLPESLTLTIDEDFGLFNAAIDEDFGLFNHTALSRYKEDYGREAPAMLVLDEMREYASHMSETLAKVKDFMRTSDAFDELIMVVEMVKGDLCPAGEFDSEGDRSQLISDFKERFSKSSLSLDVEIYGIKKILEWDWLASDESYSIEVFRVLELCLKRFENLTDRMYGRVMS